MSFEPPQTSDIEELEVEIAALKKDLVMVISTGDNG